MSLFLFFPETLISSQAHGWHVPDPACAHEQVRVLAWCRYQTEYSLSVFATCVACDGAGWVQEVHGQLRLLPQLPWDLPPG